MCNKLDYDGKLINLKLNSDCKNLPKSNATTAINIDLETNIVQDLRVVCLALFLIYLCASGRLEIDLSLSLSLSFSFVYAITRKTRHNMIVVMFACCS